MCCWNSGVISWKNARDFLKSQFYLICSVPWGITSLCKPFFENMLKHQSKFLKSTKIISFSRAFIDVETPECLLDLNSALGVTFGPTLIP